MLDQIRRPIENELTAFEPYFRKQMSTNIKLLNAINNFIIRRKGKQLRPMLVFLSAGLNGQITQASYVAAGMIELLHTATLIHDDVVDEAYERRGFFSVNALWRSKVAVLVGDFMLSQGLNVAIKNNRMDLLGVISTAVTAMSEGELLQIEHSRRLDLDEETYYDIITKKTATFIASCCASGALSADASSDKVQVMTDFGTYLGIAFQIRDDLFDYQPAGITGKPTGNDIREKKLTLPLIYALRASNPAQRRHILKMVRAADRSNKAVEEVVAFTLQHGGIEYAIKKMLDYRDRAKLSLRHFQNSDYRYSLELLCDYVVERKK